MIEKLEKLEKENAELKRLLRLALNDFDFIYREHSCMGMMCESCCPYSITTNRCKSEWKHAEEVKEILKNE